MVDDLCSTLLAAQQLHEPPAGFDLECLLTRTKLAQNAALTLRHRRVGLDVGLGGNSITYQADYFRSAQ